MSRDLVHQEHGRWTTHLDAALPMVSFHLQFRKLAMCTGDVCPLQGGRPKRLNVRDGGAKLNVRHQSADQGPLWRLLNVDLASHFSNDRQENVAPFTDAELGA